MKPNTLMRVEQLTARAVELKNRTTQFDDLFALRPDLAIWLADLLTVTNDMLELTLRPSPTSSQTDVATGPQVAPCFIVANAAVDKFRAWRDGWTTWTDRRDVATRYARREDAEAVHANDEDAWRVEPYQLPPPAAGLTASEQRAQAARCSCQGTDDYCVCQNVPDATTRAQREKSR